MSILDHDIKIAEKRRKMASILTGNRNALPSNESYNPGLYNPPIPASYGNGPVQTMQERQAIIANMQPLPLSDPSYNPKSQYYSPPIPASYGNGPVQTMQERQAIIANMQPVAANHPSHDPKSQYYSPPIPAGYDNKNRPK